MPNRNVQVQYEHAYENAMFSLYESLPEQKNSNTAPEFCMLPHAPGHLQHSMICVMDSPS